MITGKILGNRYKIQQKIGGGGMALVYKAEDLQLQRTVAVKVLRNQFGTDDEFIRRFRREAHAAASLSHPNVVSIYDVGEEEDLYYIVMELVEGMTLKSFIQEHSPLPVPEAVRIAGEILGALAHAHANRIVHRDIKPHNILISGDGRVKVTDFGIARATTTDTVTHTGGALMGSAHYFSPEQAAALPADEKSDLYSVGVVLYEMVTGTVPFQGDNPVSVALKHVRERVTQPSRLNKDVPKELEEIILRAMEKEPVDRFASAVEMQGALRQFASDFAAGRTHAAVADFPTMDLRKVREKTLLRQMSGEDDEEEVEPTKPKRKRRSYVWVWILLIAMLVVGGAGAAVYAFLSFIDVPTVTVPDVTRMDLKNAQETLQKAGLTWEIRSSQPDELPPNHVIKTIPEANTPVKQGRTIALVISKGPETRILPNLTGLNLQEAKALLEREGFQVGVVETRNARQPENTVLDTKPTARTPLPPGATVDLVVSLGPLRVPNLIGRPLKEAQQELQRLGLTPGKVDSKPDALQVKDTVLETSPPQGTEVQPGATVNLTVAAGAGRTPVQQQTATVTVEVRGPTAGQWVQVQVVLEDDIRGVIRETLIYDKQHQIGQKVPLTVTWFGKGTLKVLINGALSYTIPLVAQPAPTAPGTGTP